VEKGRFHNRCVQLGDLGEGEAQFTFRSKHENRQSFKLPNKLVHAGAIRQRPLGEPHRLNLFIGHTEGAA
jgi:hypothetical protein